MKTCRICKINKNETEYRIPKGGKYALSKCKLCEAEYRKKYRELNKEFVVQINRRYKVENKEKIRLASKEYYLKNKEICTIRNKKWRSQNKDVAAKAERVNSKRRWRNDPLYRATKIMRNRVSNAFNYHGWIKNGKTEKLLGADYQTVMLYIERQFKKGMNWNSDGKRHAWHIDHIIPLSSAKTEEELIALCHYTNLQPLWAFDNQSKSGKVPQVQIKLTI